jgi:AcrR family transcriptional regulator
MEAPSVYASPIDQKGCAVSTTTRPTATDEVTEQATRPLRADAQRNYDNLIATARTVVTEQGSDTSLEEIARRAGVGIGTLYRHFPNRLALLEAIYREDVDGLAALADRLVATESPWDAMAHWVEAFSAYAATKRVLFHEIMEVAGREAEVLSHSRKVIVAAADLTIGGAQRAGVVRNDIQVNDITRLVGGCTMMPGADAEQQRRMVRLVLDGLRVSP